MKEEWDGNPRLIRCSAPQGYPTVAAAKDAKIEEIKEKIRFHLGTIGGLLTDLKEAKTEQDRQRLYLHINAFLNEIEKGTKEEGKVRRLSLEDKSL